MHGFGLGLYHLHGVVWDRLIIDGRIFGCGELGLISIIVVILVQNEAHKIINPLAHIEREKEEDRRELFTESCEVSVIRMPRNGVKYVEPRCKQ